MKNVAISDFLHSTILHPEVVGGFANLVRCGSSKSLLMWVFIEQRVHGKCHLTIKARGDTTYSFLADL